MNKEEKCKELLEKIKQTPNNVIEEAIDELYIEYIKDSKEYIKHEIKTGKLINGYTDIHIFQTEVELLLKYIQHLEQKESILDKAIDKLKEDIETEDIKDDCSLFVRVFKGNLIERIKEVIVDVLNQYRREILNIIEGEKK